MWGTWVAQLVESPTLDFGSGHNLVIHEIEPPLECSVFLYILYIFENLITWAELRGGYTPNYCHHTIP